MRPRSPLGRFPRTAERIAGPNFSTGLFGLELSGHRRGDAAAGIEFGYHSHLSSGSDDSHQIVENPVGQMFIENPFVSICMLKVELQVPVSSDTFFPRYIADDDRPEVWSLQFADKRR